MTNSLHFVKGTEEESQFARKIFQLAKDGEHEAFWKLPIPPSLIAKWPRLTHAKLLTAFPDQFGFTPFDWFSRLNYQQSLDKLFFEGTLRNRNFRNAEGNL